VLGVARRHWGGLSPGNEHDERVWCPPHTLDTQANVYHARPKARWAVVGVDEKKGVAWRVEPDCQGTYIRKHMGGPRICVGVYVCRWRLSYDTLATGSKALGPTAGVGLVLNCWWHDIVASVAACMHHLASEKGLQR
jgi:hypothetical protein